MHAFLSFGTSLQGPLGFQTPLGFHSDWISGRRCGKV